MCWRSLAKLSEEFPDQSIIREAQEDIECFKVVGVRKLLFFNKFYWGREKIFSYYRNYRYKLNKLYKLKKSLKYYYTSLTTLCIDAGFHSYSSSECSCEIIADESNRKETIIEVYNHECDSKKLITHYACSFTGQYNRRYRTRIVKCIIPKGSHYAINCLGEIVSDKIILKELVNSKFH